jgi:hypothetical protein
MWYEQYVGIDVPSVTFLRNVSFLYDVQNVSGDHPPILQSFLRNRAASARS